MDNRRALSMLWLPLTSLATFHPFAYAQTTPALTLMGLVCEYCIAASDLGIERTDGKTVALSRTDLRTEPVPNAQSRLLDDRHRDRRGGKLDRLKNQTGTFLEAKMEYAYTWGRVSQGEIFAVPSLVPVKKDVKSWADLVKTEHVCLGSRFTVPTFYFKGADGKQISQPPGTHMAGDSAHFRELPSTTTQTICEGELRSISSVLASFVEKQTSVAIEKFETANSPDAVDNKMRAAVNAWLDLNRPTLAAQAAAVNRALPAAPGK